MRRSAFVVSLVAAVLALTFAAAPAGATAITAPGGVVAVPSHKFKTFKSSSTARVGIRPALSTLDDPPSGGCQEDVNASTTGEYDGTTLALIATETSYAGTLICEVGTPGQTMRYLWIQSSMFINGGLREPQPGPGECSHEVPTDAPCTEIDSVGSAFCLAASERCDGFYAATIEYDMLLPDGWVYTDWPSSCQQIGPPELACHAGTKTYTVPPVYPA